MLFNEHSLLFQDSTSAKDPASSAVVSRDGNTGIEVTDHQGQSHGNTAQPFKRAIKMARIKQTVHATSW